MSTVDEPTREGAHVMTVCNACRYCEQYCPVFPAMEQRLTFARADLNYLANLCHNCGECLYACQYAPPHEFAINVPRTLATIRLRSYEQYAWPAAFSQAFRHHGLGAGTVLAAALIAVLFVATVTVNGAAVWDPGGSGDFYAVVPHGVMVALFGGVGLFVLVALWIGVARCRRDIASPAASGSRQPDGASRSLQNPLGSAFGRKAIRDILSLRHLHATGEDCVSAEESRTPWRRWLHHATFYGFALCFASTSVAAVYHFVGWPAPYAYTSVPVLLGTLGGFGLVVGPLGLLLRRRRRDPALGDPAHDRLDQSFTFLLLLTSATGLLLLALRHQPVMGLLLIVHLGLVLALFLTLPYGKFVHGLYRAVALLKYWKEEAADAPRSGSH